MPLYRFGVDTGQAGADIFDSAHESFRSASEQRHTPVAIYDLESYDLKMARQLADEIINVSGAEVNIYIRTDNADFDSVWDEDPDPTYWQKVPMKAFFKPTPLETELKKWGGDTINKAEVVFSHRHLFLEFGERMLRTGDVLQLPYNAANNSLTPKNYRIVNCTPSGNFRYTWLYYSCAVETLTADVTVRPDDMDHMPVDEAIRSGGQYRESI